MRFAPWILFGMSFTACIIKNESNCPSHYTPDDPACAWNFCQDHPKDDRCADASAEGGTDAIIGSDTGTETDGGDGRVDANTKCVTRSDCQDRSSTPACDLVSGACVECVLSNDSFCTSNGKVCNPSTFSCVECNTDADCAQPGKAKCDVATHQCVACTDNTQCAHVKVGDNDDLDICNAGTCVQCTPATETTECGATACDPEALSCTMTERGTLPVCRPCRADSECWAEHKCVEVPFKGMSSGYYCMPKVPITGCQSPYRATQLTVRSKNDPSLADYCVHDTSSASCRAVLSMDSNSIACTPETAETACGPGARCEKLGTSGSSLRCTYSCANSTLCNSFIKCGGPSTPTFCGGTPALPDP
jgi:hypothetical protein